MPGSTHKLSYHATGGSFFALGLKNALLTMITLGIYSSWARNNVRAFHYSHTELGDERFAYHGTGGELFSGALKAGLVLFVLAMLYGGGTILVGRYMNVEVLPPNIQIAFTLALYAVIGLLVVVAINGARRYRLSRSSWRGIRFSFHGQTNDYLALMVKGFLLSVVTLGFYRPIFQSQARAFMVNNARFGSEPFEYDGDGRELFGDYLRAVLLTIPTLGLAWVWYAAARHRYFWDHTRIAGARFSSTVTGGELLSLSLTNALLVIFTLGIGAPWAMVRLHQFWASNLRLHGAPEWATIEQRAQDASATHEGLAEGMDIDVGIGL